MPNWTESMQQTFEFYIVDPDTWSDKTLLTTVKSATINRDLGVDTLGSATFDIIDSIGECYLRVYLVTIQNGIRERFPLGTFLVQTPTSTFDGKTRNVSMDAYTPLLELKEKSPDIGYYVPKTRYNVVTMGSNGVWIETDSGTRPPVAGDPIDGAKTTSGKQVYGWSTPAHVGCYCVDESLTDMVYNILQDKVRAPKVQSQTTAVLANDFVADLNDTWFSFLSDLLANANMTFDLDEMGRILFVPYKDLESMQPIWTYNDDNSSILYPEITMDHDLYGIPNVVEVRFFDGVNNHECRVVNDDAGSPTSIQNRGREIVHRVTEINLPGLLRENDPYVEQYATQLLKQLSTIEYSITYTHGYCPVRVGDCVQLNYSRAGLTNIKAKVVSQSIKCETGCSVTEKAIFTTKLWG